jgi:hypothetical protein
MVCGSGSDRCGRGGEGCVHSSLWRSRFREISTDVLVAGTKLVLRLTNTVTDDWEHCLGPSDEMLMVTGSLFDEILNSPVPYWQ